MALNSAIPAPQRPGLPGRIAWAVGLVLAAASVPAQAWPPFDDDAIGIGGGLTITTPIGPGGLSYRETSIGYEAGATAPVYARDGDYTGRGNLRAVLGGSVWLVPLLEGDLRQAFSPMTLRVGFNSTEKYAPSGDYSDPGFGLENSADVVVPLDGGTPGFELRSILSLDPGDLGPVWLRFQFPLLEYHYSSLSGSTSRLLGLTLELGSVDLAPCTLGQACEFDKGYWGFTVQTVPEPSSAALCMAGGLALWAATRRRRQGARPVRG